MIQKKKNLSDYQPDAISSGKDHKIGIVISDWNYEVTGQLLQGAVDTLIKHEVEENNIEIIHVPGAYELTFGAAALLDTDFYDAIIVLGCVIQGETRHFDFICHGVTQGITQLNLKAEAPIIFGLLTTDNMEQALDRCGGKHGNKGVEAAVTALRMIETHSYLLDTENEMLFGDF